MADRFSQLNKAFIVLADAVQSIEPEIADRLRRTDQPGRVRGLNKLILRLMSAAHAPHSGPCSDRAMQQWSRWSSTLQAAIAVRAAVWAIRDATAPAHNRFGLARVDDACAALASNPAG